MAEPKAAERDDGVYYVTLKGEPRRTLALWGFIHPGDTEKHWKVPGVPDVKDDADLLEIGDRISGNHDH